MEIFTTNSSRLEEKETFPLYLETILLIEIIPKPCIEESFFVVMKEPFLYFNFLLNAKMILCRITAKGDASVLVTTLGSFNAIIQQITKQRT